VGKLLKLLLVVVLFSSSFAQSPEVILDTSFEEYSVGTLPSGFRIKYNGKGNSYQVVTDKKSYSGEKSFQVWGTYGWCANIHYDFDVFKHKYVEVQWKMFTTDDNNGWNNIGTPCDIDKSQFDTLFSSARLVWVWDNDKKLWKFWSPDKTLRDKAVLYGIELLEEISKLQGIWVYKR
jgi:hypothetical protein